MKHLAGLLIFLFMISCAPGAHAGSGEVAPENTIGLITLPPQWTETYTREPTLPDPTDTGTPVPTVTRTLVPTSTKTPTATDYSGPMEFEKIRTLNAGEPIVGVDYQPILQRLISISATGNVRLYDTVQGERLLNKNIDSSGWASVALDPYGDYFILGLRDRIEIRNSQTTEVVHLIQEGILNVRGISFFARKGILAVTGENGLQLFSNLSGRASDIPRRSADSLFMEATTRPVFNPDGTELGFGGLYNGDPTLEIEYLDMCSEGICFNGGESGNVFGTYGTIADLQFSKEGGLVVVSGGSIAVMDASRTDVRNHIEVRNPLHIALAEEDHLLVAGTADGRLLLMRFPSLEIIVNIPAHQGKINQLLYNGADGVMVTAGEDGKIILWKIVKK
jgi:WD40 repeat protein